MFVNKRLIYNVLLSPFNVLEYNNKDINSKKEYVYVKYEDLKEIGISKKEKIIEIKKEKKSY